MNRERSWRKNGQRPRRRRRTRGKPCSWLASPCHFSWVMCIGMARHSLGYAPHLADEFTQPIQQRCIFWGDGDESLTGFPCVGRASRRGDRLLSVMVHGGDEPERSEDQHQP